MKNFANTGQTDQVMLFYWIGMMGSGATEKDLDILCGEQWHLYKTSLLRRDLIRRKVYPIDYASQGDSRDAVVYKLPPLMSIKHFIKMIPGTEEEIQTMHKLICRLLLQKLYKMKKILN